MILRIAWLSLLITVAVLAQDDPIATRFQRAQSLLSARHKRAEGTGWDQLKDLVRECDSVQSPYVSCTQVWDRYAVELELDHKPDTVRPLELYYRKALELAERVSATDPVMAPALEIEALAAADLDDQNRARELSARAFTIRQRIVASMSTDYTAGSVYRVGGGVSRPTLVRKVDPEYSEIARLLKYSGTVLLSLVVGTDGQAVQLRLVKGLGLGLDEKAAEALLQWKFNPAMKEDSPVNARATVEINFRLL
jgi:TonB family protein